MLTEELQGKYGPRFYINDEAWPFNTPIEAALGALEVWEIRNEADGDHPFHLHGMFFQHMSVDGMDKTTLGWKDTLLVPARDRVRFAVRYETLGGWMYHCQIPEHAERGMMGEVMVKSP